MARAGTDSESAASRRGDEGSFIAPQDRARANTRWPDIQILVVGVVALFMGYAGGVVAGEPDVAGRAGIVFAALLGLIAAAAVLRFANVAQARHARIGLVAGIEEDLDRARSRLLERRPELERDGGREHDAAALLRRMYAATDSREQSA